ncbi:MAG: M1 family metallopeptidase [Bacteroidales bacterium]
MRKIPITLAGLILLSQIIQAQIINKIPLSDRFTGYRINASLDTREKVVSGSMDAFWVNHSSDTVPDIRLHLYMNAFRSNRTTFYRERGGSPGSRESDLGWIEIKTLTDMNGQDLKPGMQYISPDDGNPEDRTVLRVILPEPAKPGDTVFIRTDFETKLPSNITRTGYSDDFFFVAQWFPKFGVYEVTGQRNVVRGGWNCHQFHANSEFYADHSVYDVSITLPSDYITGSCGMLMSENFEGDSLKTLVYRAEDIVDFAWTAWPGYSVFTDHWNNVTITLLLPAERKAQAERQFIAVKDALEYLNDHVGPYPWPYLTFVDPPIKGAGAGGMEYTTLFTSMSSLFMPRSFHMPELVTIHEFGHAYFMGILASNEFEEPWLDEGVNSFWEGRIMDHYYGTRSGVLNHPLLKIPDITYARLSYVMSPLKQLISNAAYSWNYPRGAYAMMSYQKTATWLYSLMGLVGEKTMDDIFREYYRKWAFRHPSGKDFVNVVNEVVKKDCGNQFGNDMNWYFDETLYGTGICDYKVSGIRNTKFRKPQGRTELPDTLANRYPEADSLYTAVAQVERVGEVKIPVDVLIHFSNGDQVIEKWGGKERYKDYTFSGYREIDRVVIDPDFKNPMDVNYINNSMTTSPDRVPVRRVADKLMAFLGFWLSIFLI